MSSRAKQLFVRFRSPINIVAALCVVALVIVVRGRGGEVPVAEQAPTIPLVIESADEIDAGEPWTFGVTGRTGRIETDATFFEVHVAGPWGVRTLELEPTDDWLVTVPGELTQRSGVLTATVRVGDAVGSGFVEVLPLDAVDGAIPLAGPRSIVADFEHWTMVSAFPRDRYGNSVADGTETIVHVRRPDGSVDEAVTEVEHLLSVVRVWSESLAGRTALRLDTQDATGPEVEVLEVPGPPVAVEVVDPEIPLRADGRMLVNLETDVLVDQFGNVLLDGTSGVVRMDGPLGKGTLRPFTIDGRFEFYIEAPPVPGTVTLDVEVDGVRSEPIELEFASDVSELPVDSVRTADGVRVTVGEVLSVHGGYVPDGTAVVLTVNGVEDDLDIFDGIAVFELDADDIEPGDVIAVEVLGTRVEVESP